jgi:hypothetical protein
LLRNILAMMRSQMLLKIILTIDYNTFITFKKGAH